MEGNSIETAVVVISNSSPSLSGASISPAAAFETSTLSVICTGWYDADGDAEGYRYQWMKDPVIIPLATNPTLTSGFFEEGDTISCVATAWDGTVEGNSIETAPVVISAPAATMTQPLMHFGLGILEDATFFPGGEFVATAGGIGVVIWDPVTSEKVRVLNEAGHYVRSVDVPSDGAHLISGGDDRTARLWDRETGVEVRRFSGHADSVLAVAISADGSYALTGSSDNTAKLWDTADNSAPLRTYTEHTNDVTGVDFLQSGGLALTGSLDHTAKLWSLETATSLITYSGHGNGILSAAFSPDGAQVLTGSKDNTARIWGIWSGSPAQTVLSGHTEWVNSTAFSPDNLSLLTGSKDLQIGIWDATSGARTDTAFGHTKEVLSVDYSSDGTRFLSASRDNTAKLWSAASGEETGSFLGHTDEVWAVDFSPGGDLVLTGSIDAVARLWDTETGRFVGDLKGHVNRINTVAFHPTDGNLLLTGSEDNNVILWNASDGTEIRRFTGHGGPVYSVSFSSDGVHILTGSEDRTSIIWNVSDGSIERTFSHTSSINSAVFSPDERYVLAGTGDDTAILWNRSDGATSKTFTGHSNSVLSVAFSPDGKLILTGSRDNTARLWSVANHTTPLRVISGHTDRVASVAFNSDGKIFLTASWDGSARIWDSATGAPIRLYLGHTKSVHALALSPGGERFVTGGKDGLALLWETTPAPSARIKDKLIIVAGGGNYPGNPIADQTKALAELTHFTSTVRGFSPDDILYLSAFDTTVANPNVDGEATASNLTDAIENWAYDASRLTIMMLDHGTRDPDAPGGPEWYFLMDGAQAPKHYMSASDLDSVLDAAQSGYDPLSEVHLYVDMCYAGGFLKKCSGAPVGTKRLVITGTAEDRLANFGTSNGSLSFTAFFLSSAIQGNTFYDSFTIAREAMVALNVPATAPQLPWFDDNGDGTYSKDDGSVARQRVLGNNPAFGFLPPDIIDARPDANIDKPEDFQIWCEIGPGEIQRVEAVVSYSGSIYASGEPITTTHLDFLELTRQSETNRWTATIPSSTFDEEGDYTILYTVIRDDGFGIALTSPPLARKVHMTTRSGVEQNRWVLYK